MRFRSLTPSGSTGQPSSSGRNLCGGPQGQEDSGFFSGMLQDAVLLNPEKILVNTQIYPLAPYGCDSNVFITHGNISYPRVIPRRRELN